MSVILAIIPVYLIVGIGVFLRKTGTLRKEADAGIMKVAVHVMMPALILDNIIGHPSMRQVDVVFGSIAFGFGFVAAGIFLGYFISGLMGMRKGQGRRTFSAAAGVPNYGYLAIPLIAAFFPDDGAMAVLFVHNVGVEIAVWTVALMMTIGSFKFSPKVFAKGPILAVIFGIIVNFSGTASHVPDPVMVTFKMLGNCALPVALLLIGSALYDLWGREKISLRLCSGAVLLRLMLFPAMILIVAYLLPLSLPLKQVLAVQASLPAGMFAIILAKHYDGHVGVAAQVVLSSTVVSIVTMPVVLYLGMSLLGLQ